jgi:hypothetical protein
MGLMTTMLDFYGGGLQNKTLDGSVYTLGNKYELDSEYAWNTYRIWRITPTNANAHVELPAASALGIPAGGIHYFIENLDAATYGVKVYAHDGVFVGEAGPQNALSYNQCFVCCLRPDIELWTMFGVRSSASPVFSNATLGP